MIEHNIHKKGKLLKFKWSMLFEIGYSKWDFLRCNAHLNLSDVNGSRNNQYYVMQLCKGKIVLKNPHNILRALIIKLFLHFILF